MKNIRHIAVAILLTINLHFTASGQSQTAMGLQAGRQYQKADQELNIVYRKILKEYAQQKAFIAKLKTAQRLWVQLRDAELEARFPQPNQYGSALPMCRAAYMEDLTRQRIKFLQVWLRGIPEGDVCNGSVKIAR